MLETITFILNVILFFVVCVTIGSIAAFIVICIFETKSVFRSDKEFQALDYHRIFCFKYEYIDSNDQTVECYLPPNVVNYDVSTYHSEYQYMSLMLHNQFNHTFSFDESKMNKMLNDWLPMEIEKRNNFFHIARLFSRNNVEYHSMLFCYVLWHRENEKYHGGPEWSEWKELTKYLRKSTFGSDFDNNHSMGFMGLNHDLMKMFKLNGCSRLKLFSMVFADLTVKTKGGFTILWEGFALLFEDIRNVIKRQWLRMKE